MEALRSVTEPIQDVVECYGSIMASLRTHYGTLQNVVKALWDITKRYGAVTERCGVLLDHYGMLWKHCRSVTGRC